MPEQAAWHHGAEGWYFARRNGSGDVAIKRTRNGETQEIVNIPKDEWIHLVASVSKRGATKFQVARARELHG